jgi:hypothetical protein
MMTMLRFIEMLPFVLLRCSGFRPEAEWARFRRPPQE